MDSHDLMVPKKFSVLFINNQLHLQVPQPGSLKWNTVFGVIK